MTTVVERINDSLTAITALAGRSLVQVRSGATAGGAGVVWRVDVAPSAAGLPGAAQGLIVTNAHVVAHGPALVVFADGAQTPARAVATDAAADLALLSVSAPGPVHAGAGYGQAIVVGDSRRLRAGALVLAAGHPWGVEGAVTAGVVIGAGRAWPGLPGDGRPWLVANIRLRPGNSGGPLFDAEGRLVGLNTAVAGPDVGMAVPVHVVDAFVREALGEPSRMA